MPGHFGFLQFLLCVPTVKRGGQSFSAQYKNADEENSQAGILEF